MTKTHIILTVLLTLFGYNAATAKEVKDTLISDAGDRIILTYSVTNSGGQVSVKFTNAQKKLGSQHQKKYKKLDEVAIVFFDRNGNYADMKFDGMETSAFMVPAGATYTRSKDGYFLLNDYPTLQLSLQQGETPQLHLPLFLASYEGKRHYKVFAQCGTLTIDTKQPKKVGGSKTGGGASSRNGGGSDVYAANADNLEIVDGTEELEDEGLSPSEEALIRINSLKSMLEDAEEYPFDEELTHEAAMLRELRMKVTDDDDVVAQIAEALELYSAKKKELAGEAKGAAAAKEAAAAQAAEAAQARNDSIAASQLLQSEEDKKNMMWIGGGIAGLIALFMGGKQIMQMVNQHKMQKQQQAIMNNMMKMAQQQSAGIPGMPDMNNIPGMPNTGNIPGMPNNMANIPGMPKASDIPGLSEATAAVNGATATAKQAQQQVRSMSREAEAAREKLKSLRTAKQGKTETATGAESAPATQQQSHWVQSSTTSTPTHTSLNDAIPTKYKRLAPKRKGSQNT